MIAIIDFSAFVFTVIAMGLILVKPPCLSKKTHFMLLGLLGLTAIFNSFSAIEWFKQLIGPVNNSLAETEKFHDYLQPLQALIWLGLIYLLLHVHRDVSHK